MIYWKWIAVAVAAATGQTIFMTNFIRLRILRVFTCVKIISSISIQYLPFAAIGRSSTSDMIENKKIRKTKIPWISGTNSEWNAIHNPNTLIHQIQTKNMNIITSWLYTPQLYTNVLWNNIIEFALLAVLWNTRFFCSIERCSWFAITIMKYAAKWIGSAWTYC